MLDIKSMFLHVFNSITLPQQMSTNCQIVKFRKKATYLLDHPMDSIVNIVFTISFVKLSFHSLMLAKYMWLEWLAHEEPIAALRDSTRP